MPSRKLRDSAAASGGSEGDGDAGGSGAARSRVVSAGHASRVAPPSRSAAITRAVCHGHGPRAPPGISHPQAARGAPVAATAALLCLHHRTDPGQPPERGMRAGRSAIHHARPRRGASRATGTALRPGTARRGTAGHAHRRRRQRNHATCVMAFHAGRREARVDSTTGPYRRIPKRLDPARSREHQLRHDPITIGQGPRQGRAPAVQRSKGESP
jgi:hypothetical protein